MMWKKRTKKKLTKKIIKMSENKTYVNGGIGFGGLLTIAFIVLKLCKVINWSWWWVVSPILITPAVYVLVFLVVFIVMIFARRQ